MRKILAAVCGLAAAGLIAAPAAAQASTRTIARPANSCNFGQGVSYKGTLTRIVEQLPSGPTNAILGGELFVITCQPLSGSVTIQLQYRKGTTWVDAGHSSRFNFPTTDRGFGLSVGPWICQGFSYNKTSWRIPLFSSGVAGDGTVWGPTTSWDSLIGGSAGKYFDCG